MKVFNGLKVLQTNNAKFIEANKEEAKKIIENIPTNAVIRIIVDTGRNKK